MSDFSSNYETDLSSSNESLPDMSKKLIPYDHEPVCKPRQLSDLNDDDESDADDSSRIGNVDWCQCGKCEIMETDAESLCYQDTNKVPEELD